MAGYHHGYGKAFEHAIRKCTAISIDCRKALSTTVRTVSSQTVSVSSLLLPLSTAYHNRAPAIGVDSAFKQF
jgi:hypothetical protein